MTRVQSRIQDSAELHRIVAEVERRPSVAARLGVAVETTLARARRLRQAVLKHAF
jgi:hypothetical protein